MAATPNPGDAATPCIDFEVFDEKTADLGADDETARARLIGVDRVTLWRWRHGRQSPTLDTASRIASQLNITLDQLTGRAA